MFRPACGHLQAGFVYEEVNVIDLYVRVGIAIRLHMNLCLGLLPNIVGTTERPTAGVSCGQFGTVHLNLLKPTGYVMYHHFNIQQLYALPTLYLCVLYSSENK